MVAPELQNARKQLVSLQLGQSMRQLPPEEHRVPNSIKKYERSGQQLLEPELVQGNWNVAGIVLPARSDLRSLCRGRSDYACLGGSCAMHVPSLSKFLINCIAFACPNRLAWAASVLANAYTGSAPELVAARGVSHHRVSALGY